MPRQLHLVHARKRLRWHGYFIGLCTAISVWLSSSLLYWAGLETPALRYALALIMGYLLYLLMLKQWAIWFFAQNKRKDQQETGNSLEGLPTDTASTPTCQAPNATPIQTGGSGDFAGAGAHEAWDEPADLLAQGGELTGQIGEHATSLLDGADEASLALIPIALVLGLLSLSLLGLGAAFMVFFGSEVLMAIALELALGYTAARIARQLAEGVWLDIAWRLTWKPFALTLALAIALAGVLQYFFPEAKTLVQAMRLLLA